jgi:hypothetical protein
VTHLELTNEGPIRLTQSLLHTQFNACEQAMRDLKTVSNLSARIIAAYGLTY